MKTLQNFYFSFNLEDEFSMKSFKEYENMQLGDVQFTSSDCSSLTEWILL